MPQICWCGNERLGEYSESYYQCDSCRTLVSKNEFDQSLYNVRDEERDFYGAHYWTAEMLKEANVASVDEINELYLKERVPYWLKHLQKYVLPPAKIAEIGGGLGQFSYLLKLAGFEQVMYELSPNVCQYSRDVFGLNARCADFTRTEGLYDCIAAFDVIEHIIDVGHFMAAISAKITRNGVLCLQTPCYDETLDHERMLRAKPRFASSLRPEQHIYIFSRHSMEKLLRLHGFDYIIFEPAVFGDDYDMFLFASPSPLIPKSSQETEAWLRGVNGGHIVRALWTLAGDHLLLQRRLGEQEEVTGIEREAAATRLTQVEDLSRQLRQSQERAAEQEEAATARLTQVEDLSRQLRQSQERAAQQEEAAVRRLDQITELTDWMEREQKKSEEYRTLLADRDTQLTKAWQAINDTFTLLTEKRLENKVVLEQLNLVSAEAGKRLDDVHVLHRIVAELRTEKEEAQSLHEAVRQENEQLKENNSKLSKRRQETEQQFWFRALRRIGLISSGRDE
jgi:2-polyprenyl-3-methyl-5-hydroxy-6-metoxy-1,4-benzoquinol methylase